MSTPSTDSAPSTPNTSAPSTNASSVTAPSTNPSSAGTSSPNAVSETTPSPSEHSAVPSSPSTGSQAPSSPSLRSVTTSSPNAISETTPSSTASSPGVGEGARERADNLEHRLLISAPFAILALVLSMAPPLQFSGWQWVVALASIPVTTWGAWPFHKAAFAAGRHGSTTMDTLVSLGVIASSLWSWWALLFGGAGELGMRMSMTFLPRASQATHAQIYFEGACTIVVFLLTGRWMEARARYRAGDALRSLLELGAKEAIRVDIDPTSGARSFVRIPAADLAINDLFLVKPGEKVATDGVIVEGATALDTSLLTGESAPVDVSEGDTVTGATMNTWGSILVKATRVGADTTLARIGRMVTEAQAGKAPVQRLADSISSIFVPLVIGVFLLTLAGWLIWGAPLQASFTAAVSVLVVACPCALGLATPTALLVGSGRASQLGIVIKSAEILEQTRSIDTILLDKTGTVTTGRMFLEEVCATSGVKTTAEVLCDEERGSEEISEEEALAVAAGVESASEHPIARAILAGAHERGITPTQVTAFTNHAGLGASAIIHRPDGPALALVGRATWLADMGVTLSEEHHRALAEAKRRGASAVVAAIVATWIDEGGAHSSTEPTGSGHVLPKEDTPLPLATITMNVQGMTCASCVRRVERKLGKLEGVSAQVNLATETATILLSSEHSNEELERVVDKAGYSGTILERHEASELVPASPSLDENGEEERETQERVLPATLEGVKALAVLILSDTVKPSSAEAIERLKELDIEPILLTGDNEAAARRVAEQVGIHRVIAQVMPDEKRDVVASLQEQGHVVAMVGDGVNDAAALAQAGVQGLGIAMGSGTDVAIEVADITLMNSELTSVATAIRISRRTLRIIKGNLFWAFAYNVAMIPLAIAGLLNPMFASAAMAFSSVFVVLNSLRLRNAD
ncbi:copper-exporting ATPase [Schaalia cardiffensis F0333]|uniref:Cation-transporting P-type ATPase B n=1 Tax=Schaalia cardiffensis F0333 TaxID=888050 RepID=N6X4F5_9ACTO|nr:copper-exporting ATPase [Schaalia cardiffensis F0333]